jgi:1,4-alpha-glucan branching enzyme
MITGLKRAIFRNARLRGSWDARGRSSNDWTQSPMQEDVSEDGCAMFTVSVGLDLADQQRTFKWGVVLDGPQGSNFWGIPTEVQDVNSVERYRQFRLTGGATQVERCLSKEPGPLDAQEHPARGCAPGRATTL